MLLLFCAELTRGLWHSEDLDSSTSSSKAADLGPVGPFPSPPFLICKMSYDRQDGLSPRVKALWVVESFSSGFLFIFPVAKQQPLGQRPCTRHGVPVSFGGAEREDVLCRAPRPSPGLLYGQALRSRNQGGALAAASAFPMACSAESPRAPPQWGPLFLGTAHKMWQRAALGPACVCEANTELLVGDPGNANPTFAEPHVVSQPTWGCCCHSQAAGAGGSPPWA